MKIKNKDEENYRVVESGGRFYAEQKIIKFWGIIKIWKPLSCYGFDHDIPISDSSLYKALNRIDVTIEARNTATADKIHPFCPPKKKIISRSVN